MPLWLFSSLHRSLSLAALPTCAVPMGEHLDRLVCCLLGIGCPKARQKNQTCDFFSRGYNSHTLGYAGIYIHTYKYVRIYIKDSYTDGYIHKDDLPGWTVGPLDRVIRRIPVEVIDMLSKGSYSASAVASANWVLPVGTSPPRIFTGEIWGEIWRNHEKSKVGEFPMAAWDISWMIWWVTSHNVSGKRGHIASLSFGLRWTLCQEGPLYPRWSQPRLRKNFGARWWAQVLMAEKCSTSLL